MGRRVDQEEILLWVQPGRSGLRSGSPGGSLVMNCSPVPRRSHENLSSVSLPSVPGSPSHGGGGAQGLKNEEEEQPERPELWKSGLRLPAEVTTATGVDSAIASLACQSSPLDFIPSPSVVCGVSPVTISKQSPVSRKRLQDTHSILRAAPPPPPTPHSPLILLHFVFAASPSRNNSTPTSFSSTFGSSIVQRMNRFICSPLADSFYRFLVLSSAANPTASQSRQESAIFWTLRSGDLYSWIDHTTFS